MEKLDKYRVYIQQLLTEYAHRGSANREIEKQFICDLVNDYYQLVYVGWKNRRRTYGCVLHLDIKNCKIWIQHDGTEIGIANELQDLRKIPLKPLFLCFLCVLCGSFFRYCCVSPKLVKLGVPKEDIVLAFHEPFVREYTGFAVG